jgi:ADP-ribosyl-[dinitrogen reductase] hydrolase
MPTPPPEHAGISDAGTASPDGKAVAVHPSASASSSSRSAPAVENGSIAKTDADRTYASAVSSSLAAVRKLSVAFPVCSVHAQPTGVSLERVSVFGDRIFELSLLDDLAASSRALNRGMGALVGLAVGDGIGAPLEFIDAADESGRGEARFDFDAFASGNDDAAYRSPFNKFRLKPGQWTDDCSMALCIADSLLKSGRFDGSDTRLRFWSWWFCGLNNAFRKDAERRRAVPGSYGSEGCGSVGLGGNISRSLYSMKPGLAPSAHYEASTPDAGNGSLMRLAPIALFHCTDEREAANDAAWSSLTTHPGPIASEACRFLAHLLVRAMRDYEPQRPSPSADALPEASSARDFLFAVADEYEAHLGATRPRDSGVDEIRRLLRSSEADDGKERCWNWRAPRLRVAATLAARGSTYNGYPVSPGYFGSFCIDGLAMALHSVASTDSFERAIEHCVNLLGDADSTASIAGQIAGALYGYGAIHERFKANLHRWDDGQIAMRAALLVSREQKPAASAAKEASGGSRGKARADEDPEAGALPV